MSDWVKTPSGWEQSGGNGIGRAEFNEVKDSLTQKENTIREFDSWDDYEAHKSEVAEGDYFTVKDVVDVRIPKVKLLKEYNATSTENTVTLSDSLEHYNLVAISYYTTTGILYGSTIIPVATFRNNTGGFKIYEPNSSTNFATIKYVSDYTVKIKVETTGNKYVSIIGM